MCWSSTCPSTGLPLPWPPGVEGEGAGGVQDHELDVHMRPAATLQSSTGPARPCGAAHDAENAADEQHGEQR
eukprot:9152588-Pyramimonas_sp.AAC.1